MGITKSELFKKRKNRIASLAKAFDHPARIAILEYLVTNRTCITNDLVNELPLSQSTISQHLKELKQIGVIKGEVEGPMNRIQSLSPAVVSGHLEHLWIYLSAPMLGAGLAIGSWKIIKSE